MIVSPAFMYSSCSPGCGRPPMSGSISTGLRWLLYRGHGCVNGSWAVVRRCDPQPQAFG